MKLVHYAHSACGRSRPIFGLRRSLLWGLSAVLLFASGCTKAPEERSVQTPASSASEEPLRPTEPKPAAPSSKASSAIVREPWGEHDGKPVERFTLTNGNGWMLRAITYGAIITELHVPDSKGQFADVVLGRDSLGDYEKESPYFGATIGRVANRIKNAQFSLDGKKYSLAKNDGDNALHGGKKGWDKVVWTAEAKETAEGPELILRYTSPDGEEGYPGTIQASATYTLTNDNELKVEMRATTDKTTIVNMAHHSYWNLGGQSSGTILDHELTVFASKYTPAVNLVPGGEVKSVNGTPFDFTNPKLIGLDLEKAGGSPVGFDHNWVVDGDAHRLRPVARLKHEASGRVMEISADQPGLQFYSGNFLDGTLEGKAGFHYPQYSGLCLESQRFPNSINVPAWRDAVVLKPGGEYKHIMIHRFTTE